MLDRSMSTESSLRKKAAPGWPSRSSSGLVIDETFDFETVGQRDRKSFHFKLEPSCEPQILRPRISGRNKMNISEYPFSTFIGIDVSKDKTLVRTDQLWRGSVSGQQKRRPGDCTPERQQSVIDAPKQLAIPRVVASPRF